ncbi:MAG: deoxyuridine 5'-triphosphate nucleotidohydrolase [Lachnospiraceae bacterium]|nr:deoxyuridine 5'-triphosphate nucleotidohydrolase [Lachnospiraceae bacterium]
MAETVKITYLSKEIDKLTYIDGKSDWIDLRSAENVEMKKGEFRLINLGVSMSLPDGYEMIIAPRSSTFKNFGLIQTNSIGVIDESYGKNSCKDVLMMPVYAVRDTQIKVNDRICQFRIQKHQPKILFEELEIGALDGEERSGFGSTGKQ